MFAQEILKNRRRTETNQLLEHLDNLGITSREKGETFVTVGILEAMFGSGCLKKTFAEIAASHSGTFATELSDTVIHKVAHKITDLPAEPQQGYFIGHYTSSKGRYFVKQDNKTGNKWIYTAFEENSVKTGNSEFMSI